MSLLKDWQSYQWAVFTALHVGMKSKDSTLLEYVSGPEKGKESVLAAPTQGSKDSWGTILQGVEVAHVYAALDRLTEHQRALMSYLYGPRHSDREASLLLNYGWYMAEEWRPLSPNSDQAYDIKCVAFGIQEPHNPTFKSRGGYEHATNHVLAVRHGLEAYRRAAVNQSRPSHSEAATAMGISRTLYYRKKWNDCQDALYDAFEELNGSALRRVAQYFNDIRNREAA